MKSTLSRIQIYGLSQMHRVISPAHSPVAQGVKNPPAVQETQQIQVWSLDWEDPLEQGTAAHFNILTGNSHGQRSLVGYSPEDCKELDMAKHAHVCMYHIHQICHRNIYPFLLPFGTQPFLQIQLLAITDVVFIHIFFFSIMSYEGYHTPCTSCLTKCSWLIFVS